MNNEHVGMPIHLCAGWDVGPLSEHDAISLRLRTLDPATMQTHELPYFTAIARPQLIELLAAINKAVAKLDAIQATPEGRTKQ